MSQWIPYEEGDELFASVNKDDTYYADWYAQFEKTDIAVKEGKEITLSLVGHLGMAYTDEDKANVPLEGIQIGQWKDGAFEPIEGAVTGEDGTATFTLPKGEYLLSATGTVEDEVVVNWETYETGMADCPIMAPYCKVEVSKDNKLEQAKQDAMQSLEDEVDLSRYNTDEQVQILSALVKAQAAIAAAESSEEIDSLVEDFRAQVAEVATKKGWLKEDGEWYYYKDGVKLTSGWAKDSKGWCYMDANGKITKNKWIKDGGEWYFLKANGYMAANEWTKDSKGWMYMNGSGKMVRNGWAKDSKGWCWCGADGYMVSSKWVKDGGSWYYLKADGYMATGTQTINGKTYNFNSSGKWIQ